MKISVFLIAIAALCIVTATDAVVNKLEGAGASFPEDIYAKWFKAFKGAKKVTYKAVGSGTGVELFTDNKVDFAGTDSFVVAQEAKKIKNGIIHIPTVGGAVVVALNVKGCNKLNLKRKDVAGIFSGKITSWEEVGCKKGGDIEVVVRADSSGTTAGFTSSVSKFDKKFARQVGAGKEVKWPNSFTKKDGNSGVGEYIKKNKNTIGYVGLGTAKSLKLKVASLENKAGKFVKPDGKGISAGLAGIKLDKELRGADSDPAGKNAYPIVSYTWLLAYEKYDGPLVCEAVKELFLFCLNRIQQKQAPGLGFAKLPKAVNKLAAAKIKGLKC